MIDLYDFFPKHFHSELKDIISTFEKDTDWVISIIYKYDLFNIDYLVVSTKGDFIHLVYMDDFDDPDSEDEADDYVVRCRYMKRRYNLPVDLSFENCRDIIYGKKIIKTDLKLKEIIDQRIM